MHTVYAHRSHKSIALLEYVQIISPNSDTTRSIPPHEPNSFDGETRYSIQFVRRSFQRRSQPSKATSSWFTSQSLDLKTWRRLVALAGSARLKKGMRFVDFSCMRSKSHSDATRASTTMVMDRTELKRSQLRYKTFSRCSM